MIDDATLLRRYATERSQAAFAEFVQRHLPLVYSAALRRLGGDVHGAQDVAQSVFCAAAREAERLAQHPVLTGWLYTATRNAVVDVLRFEHRRRTREEEASRLQATLSDSELPFDWSRLRPVLDASMDDLNDVDRQAVLLRFFEGRAFSEIGAVLRLSDDAARKRVDRALDQMRGVLGRHKILSTSAALASLLAAETVTAVPASLAASVTSAALAAGGSTAAGAGAVFVALTKLQTGLAAALIIGVAGTALVTQQHELSALRAENAGTQQQIAILSVENTALAQARARIEADLATQRAESDLAEAKRRTARDSAREMPPSANRPTSKSAAPQPVASAVALGPLPDTPDIQKQKAYWRHRYDAFFQQRELTPAQGERFVELKVHKDIAREDLQAAVQATKMRGDAPGVEQLRAKAYRPIEQEMSELLGSEGYAAVREYEITSGYRENYVEPMLPAFAAAEVPLSAQQAERFVALLRANDHYVQVKPTDITTTGFMNWDAVIAQANNILVSEQITVLRTYLNTNEPPHLIRTNRSTP